jgi:hypothetical protein
MRDDREKENRTGREEGDVDQNDRHRDPQKVTIIKIYICIDYEKIVTPTHTLKKTVEASYFAETPRQTGRGAQCPPCLSGHVSNAQCLDVVNVVTQLSEWRV